MRKLITSLLVGLVVLVAALVTSGLMAKPVAAQNANDQYSVTISQQEIDEYNAAIQNCETPSLECLVRYTLRYSAIEWINEMNGPGFTIQTDSGNTTSIQRSGAIAGIFSLTSALYANPPAQTSVYVADLVDNAGFAPPAHAQGLGFSSLTPILDLWKVFRNIAYFFFIGVFIVMGFLIMFRYKIGGNAAITAQQAIPSVIVSLILVTFSYAIAGLLVDLMYLIMVVILGIFGELLVDLSNWLTEIDSADQLLSFNIFQVISILFGSVWQNSGEIRNVINDALNSIANANAVNSVLSWAGGITVALVVSIAVLISAFRLFFELLKSYFSIILAVVMAPMILMMGAIPGKNTFVPWVKGIFGNLMAFPTVLLALVMFSKFVASGSINSGGFMPPFLLGSGASGIIGPLLGFATILALPEIVKKVKETFGASDGGFASVITDSQGVQFVAGAGKGAVNLAPSAIGSAGVGATAAYTGAKAALENPAMRNPRGVLEGMTSGVKIKDKDGKVIATRGGLTRGASAGFRGGQRVRKIFDDIKDGRFLQPDNLRDQLERIEKASQGKGDDKTKETDTRAKVND